MSDTAVDLYSGVGGWDLGLRMAGIKTIASYEWWGEANLTHQLNLGAVAQQADIRDLAVTSIPTGARFVVGSPPCTQFSFSNRGGGGDIADGLKDVEKFLEVVAETHPESWAMENVPRVADILEKEIEPRGRLRRFRDLFTTIVVVDMAEFGLPQRRRRMLAGSFSQSRLESYRGIAPHRTLGDVIRAFEAKTIEDPLYGIVLPQTRVTGCEKEPPLTPEETRMNREAKTFHPVYNVMPFPDPPHRTARTVTALCTRVSRESIVIADGERLRRLTLRERSTLQGFPITFQFHGSSYGSRLKQIGNAIPPLMTYFIGNALLDKDREAVAPPHRVPDQHALPQAVPPRVDLPGPKRRFNTSRRFRAAIPGLRFGSGVRFELANDVTGDAPRWTATFFFGTSKRIIAVEPDESMAAELLDVLYRKVARRTLVAVERRLRRLIGSTSAVELQTRWAGGPGNLHPFDVVDALGEHGDHVRRHLEPATQVLQPWLEQRFPDLSPGRLEGNVARIAAGLLVSAWFNADGFMTRDALEEAV